MPARRIPKYREQKSRGLAVVRIDGKDHYLGPYDSPESHEKYDSLIADWLKRQKVNLGHVVNITVCELILAFVQEASTYYVKDGKQTREFGCIKEACAPVRSLYESTLADEFGPLCLQKVRDEMIGLNWSRKHINKQVSRIKRMFRYGVANQLVRPEIYQALVTVPDLKKGRTDAIDHEPVKPVTDEVIEATLPELSPMLRSMVRYHRLTGCRPSEVCLLQPGAIDRSGDIWIFNPETHKTEHLEKQRVVFIGPKAQEVLSPYLDRSDDQFCFDPRKAPGARRNSRERYTKDSYGRAVRRAVARVNKKRVQVDGESAVLIERWSPNRLRHSAATAIRKKFGIEGAQVILGHSSADVTQVYAERDMKLAAKIARELG